MTERMDHSSHPRSHSAEKSESSAPQGSEASTLVDPVCGMTVKPSSPHRLQQDGREYAFCSKGCLEKFRAAPERYLAHDHQQNQREPKHDQGQRASAHHHASTKPADAPPMPKGATT